MSEEKKEPAMVEQLRDAIRASGRTLNDLEVETGVGRDQISRFLRSQRGITLDTAGRLCEALGITLAIPDSLRPARSTRRKK